MPDPDVPKINALLYREGWEPPGQTAATRPHRLLDFAEPLLGGVKCELRPCPGAGEGMVLILPYIDGQRHHTLLFPEGHRLAKFPRYKWTDHPSGCKVGTYVPEALDALP